MSWDILPYEIQCAILKEIACIPGYGLWRDGADIWTSYCSFRYQGDWGDLGDLSDLSDLSDLDPSVVDVEDSTGVTTEKHKQTPFQAVEEWKDVQRCLEICRSWNTTMISLLCLYAPTEVVIAFGSERLATAVVSRWIQKSSKRIAKPLGPWREGEIDLLWQVVRRGFTGCMHTLLGLVSRKQLQKLWEKDTWSRFYPHTAAAVGHIGALQVLKEYGLGLDGFDDGNRTPFALAVTKNHAHVVDYLLNIGVNRTVEFELYDEGMAENVNALQYAAAHGTVEVVRVLLRHGLHELGPLDENQPIALQYALGRSDRPNAIDIAWLLLPCTSDHEIEEDGHLLLFHALENDTPSELIRALVDRGASVNAPQNHGNIVPLDTAVQKGNTEMIEFLLDRGAMCTQGSIDTAYNRGDDQLVDTLLPRCTNTTIVLYALMGKTDLVRKCLAHGWEPNPFSPEGRLLARVAENGHFDICKLLVEAGADLNEPAGLRGTPLCNAIKAQHMELTKYFFAKGAKANVRNGHALQQAVIVGNLEMVRLALEHGADVNDPADRTPLVEASKGAYSQIVQLLLAHGATPNMRTGKYGTALHECIILNNLDISKLLLTNGADVNIDIPTYGTPLHLAADDGTPEMMELLIQHGADVNAQTGFHGRPIHAAIARGSTDNVKVLLEHGVNLELLGNDQLSPLAKAREYWHPSDLPAPPGSDMVSPRKKDVYDLIVEALNQQGLPVK